MTKGLTKNATSKLASSNKAKGRKARTSNAKAKPTVPARPKAVRTAGVGKRPVGRPRKAVPTASKPSNHTNNASPRRGRPPKAAVQPPAAIGPLFGVQLDYEYEPWTTGETILLAVTIIVLLGLGFLMGRVF